MGKAKALGAALRAVCVLLKCTLALALCFLCRVLVLKDSYALYFFASVLLAVPMAAYSCARSTLKKEHSLRLYNPGSHLYRLARRRWPQYVLHVATSCVLALVLAVYVATLSPAEGLACAVTLPSVLLAHLLLTRFAGRVYRKKYAEYRTSLWKDLATVAAGALLYSFLVCKFGGVDVTRSGIFHKNQLAAVADGILRGINTVTYALLNNDLALELASPFYLAVSIFMLQGGILFLALSRFFLCWFLPPGRIRSVFLPLARPTEQELPAAACNNPDEKQGKPVAGFVFLRSGAFCLSVSAVSALLVASLAWVCAHDDWARVAVDKTTLIAEQVGSEVCRIGTAAKYALLGAEFTAETKTELEAAVNSYFNQMTAKTDDYLDWYYSLGREYTELFTFLAGALENQVEQKVGEFLDTNLEEKLSPGYDLEERLGSIYDENLAEFQKARDVLFKENRIQNPNGLMQVQIRTTLPDVIQRTEKPDGILSGRQKFIVTATGGAVAGVATGIVTKKLLTKLSTKLTQKAAAKAVATAAKSAVTKGASKALTSALGGAVAGLAAGPAGAVVGVVVGVATTFGLDKLLLEIDEATSRDDYKADILECIEEERLFYLAAVQSL